MRYFMSYNDYVNNGKILEKKVDIHSDDMKMFKKCNNGEYIVEPLIYFLDHQENFFRYIEALQERRPNISFMVELTEDEAKKIPKFLVKSFEQEKRNRLKRVNDNVSVKLLDYDVTNNISFKDIEKGKKILVCSAKNGNYFLNIFDDFNFKIRTNVLGENIYFYTEDSSLLKRFESKTTVFRKNSDDTYSLEKFKVIVIDSVGQDRLVGDAHSAYRYLYDVYTRSKAVYITSDGSQYQLSEKKDLMAKKGYILTDNISSIISNPDLEPLYKYINVFELKSDKYEKIPIEEFIDKNSFKYTKKPNLN